VNTWKWIMSHIFTYYLSIWINVKYKSIYCTNAHAHIASNSVRGVNRVALGRFVLGRSMIILWFVMMLYCRCWKRCFSAHRGHVSVCNVYRGNFFCLSRISSSYQGYWVTPRDECVLFLARACTYTYNLYRTPTRIV